MKHSKRLATFTLYDKLMMIQLHLTQPQLPQDILLSRHFFQLSFFCQDIFSTTEWLMYSGLLDEALLEVGPNLGGWKLITRATKKTHALDPGGRVTIISIII